MCESVPLKAPQRRRSDSAAADPARPRRSAAQQRSALKKSSEAGRSNENKHIGRTDGRTERLHFLLYADRNWVRRCWREFLRRWEAAKKLKI